jgi:hypothetical protein
VFVEVAKVLHDGVLAVITPSLGEAVMQALTAAVLALAVVIRVWIESQEAHKGIELSYSILKRSACETPFIQRD